MVVRDFKTGSKSFGRETLKLLIVWLKVLPQVLVVLGADSVSEEAQADGRERRVKNTAAVPAVGCSHFPGQRLTHESLADAAEQCREKPPRQTRGGEKKKKVNKIPKRRRLCSVTSPLHFSFSSLIDPSVSPSFSLLSPSLCFLLPLQRRVTTARFHALEVLQNDGGGPRGVGGGGEKKFQKK